MTNSLDANTQNTLPTSFRMIGFGAESIPMIDAIQKLDYDWLTTQMAREGDEILPEDQNVMLILLITGDEERATSCAKTFYQAGVLTIVVCTKGHSLPESCCDTQSIIDKGQCIDTIKSILEILHDNGRISLDFGDLERTLKGTKYFRVYHIWGKGVKRADEINNAIKTISLSGVTSMISCIFYNKEAKQPLQMEELHKMVDFINRLPYEIGIYHGLYMDRTLMDDSIRITFIISGKGLKL